MPGKNKLQEKMWTRNFILIVLINMLVFLSFQMITPCLPLYVQKIGATEKMIGLIAGIFTITAVSVRPFIGRFLDTRAAGHIPVWYHNHLYSYFSLSFGCFLCCFFSCASFPWFRLERYDYGGRDYCYGRCTQKPFS